MADFLPLPDKEYSVIYADPPWEYRQHGTTAKSRGNAAKHYQTMTTEDICKLPVKKICGGGGTPAITPEQAELERTRCELETIRTMYERLLDRVIGKVG